MINNLSIIIPIFKEKRNIELLTNDIHKKLKKVKFEIIFVDDNSKDGSYQILKKLKKNNKAKFIKRKAKKKDLTQSCFQGIRKSKNKLINDPNPIPKSMDIKIFVVYDINNFFQPLQKVPYRNLLCLHRNPGRPNQPEHLPIWFQVVFRHQATLLPRHKLGRKLCIPISCILP